MTDVKKTKAKKPVLPKVLPEIRSLIESSRRYVAITANLSLVQLYWNIGRIITLDIQKNKKRADYGKKLLEQLAEILTTDYGRGFSVSNLNDMRRFFDQFSILQALPVESEYKPILQALPVESDKTQRGRALSAETGEAILIDFQNHSHLGWTHYRILIGIKEAIKRRFYFEQAVRERCSTRELQKRIDTTLFERVALSHDTKKLVAGEKEKGKPEVMVYEDVFKDPYLLDFLGLKGAYLEKDLEAAIIHNLELFLSELGSDFCFMARQYPMRIDDVDYFLDLLFYHRGLKCLVAIELKLGTFTAADKGQMDLYLAWLKENEWREDEREPVGLILCSSKKRQHVEMLVRHGPHKIQVSEYITKLPSKEVLEERLKVYSKLLREQ